MVFAIIETDSVGWCNELCGRNRRIWEVGGVLVDRLWLVSRRDMEMTGKVGTIERTCGSSTGPRRISGRTNWSRPSDSVAKMTTKIVKENLQELHPIKKKTSELTKFSNSKPKCTNCPIAAGPQGSRPIECGRSYPRLVCESAQFTIFSTVTPSKKI